MKTWFTTALLLCCAPLVVAQGELAERPTPPARRTHAQQQAKPEQIALRLLVRHLQLQRYDANQDGRIDREEMELMHQEAEQALKKQAVDLAAKFDLDKDGKLSPEEREAMRSSFSKKQEKTASNKPGHQPRPAKPGMMERRWKPQPQAADEVEATPQRPRKHRRSQRPHMNKMAREMAYISHQLMLQAYDKDGSGQLEEQEMKVCRQDAQVLYNQRKADLLSRFDADQDGTISPDEYKAAMESMRPAPRAGDMEHRAPGNKRPGKRGPGRRGPFNPKMAEDMELLRQLSTPTCGKSIN